MTIKIQYRGNCQCCGRLQAMLDNGQIAKHGYTVQDGWFSGVCHGHNFPPLQIGRAGLDSMIFSINTDIKFLTGRLEAYRAGTSHPDLVSNMEPGHNHRMIKWEEASDMQRRHGFRNEVSRMENRIRMGEAYIKNMNELAAEVLGTPLKEVPLLKEAGIAVGDTVRIIGETVVVTKIEFAVARGIGPGINGKHVEHIFWEKNGREYKYPKRYARKPKLANA